MWEKLFKKEFYKESWFMWVMLIFFAPIGIFLMYKYDQNFSRKTKIVISIIAIIFTVYIISSNNDSDNIEDEFQNNTEAIDKQEKLKPTRIETCDGIKITHDCIFEGVLYSKYIYYPAVEEKYHTETKTTYTTEIIGYCTLCNDGTYSPSCATGRGACSHHGGVAQFSAPIYSQVAHYEKVKVIDSPAIEEKYEKVKKNKQDS